MTDKQMIERLKTNLDFERSKRKTLQAELQAKEQECERLKYDNDYEVGALERTIDNLKSENKHLNDLLNQALKELEKTRETLTEIKEIAEAHKKDESVWNPYRQLDKILQKISEVEDEQV